MSNYPFKFGFTTAVVQEDVINTCFRFVKKEDGRTEAIPISNWAVWLMQGGNLKLLNLWNRRHILKRRKLERKLNQYFTKLNVELLTQAVKSNLDLRTENSFENGMKKSYLFIDYCIIHDILEGDEYGNIFTECVAKSIDDLYKNNIETIIFINQFSCSSVLSNYNLQELRSHLEAWQIQINSFVQSKSDENKSIYLCQILDEKTPERWRFFIDRSIELGKPYGGTSIVRFNLEWAELMPTPNEFNYTALDKYIDLIEYANSKNVDVLLCLNHMCWPLWIQGWDNPEIVTAFSNFISVVFNYFEEKNIIHLLRKILILNEPASVLSLGYLSNAWPPFRGLYSVFAQSVSGLVGNYDFLFSIFSKIWKKNPYFLAVKHMQQTHISVYKLLKIKYPTLSISTSQILMGTRKIHDASVLDIIGLYQINRAAYQWIDDIRVQAFKDKKQYFDFYAPQLYGSFALSFKNIPTGGKNQKILDNHQVHYKQVNGSLDDQSIFVVRLLEIASRCVEDGVMFEISDIKKLPKISFTEFGYVAGMISNRTYSQFIMNNISQFVGYLPSKIDYMMRWAPDDNWEWDSGYMNWARFGDVNYDGTPKPMGQNLENRFNYYDTRIYYAMKQLLYWMNRYKSFIQKKMVTSEFDEKMHKSLDVIAVKINLAEEYLKDARDKKNLLPL